MTNRTGLTHLSGKDLAGIGEALDEYLSANRTSSLFMKPWALRREEEAKHALLSTINGIVASAAASGEQEVLDRAKTTKAFTARANMPCESCGNPSSGCINGTYNVNDRRVALHKACRSCAYHRFLDEEEVLDCMADLWLSREQPKPKRSGQSSPRARGSQAFGEETMKTETLIQGNCGRCGYYGRIIKYSLYDPYSGDRHPEGYECLNCGNTWRERGMDH